MHKWIVTVANLLLLAGCVGPFNMVERADENRPLNPDKALIVGTISEEFADLPQGLSVLLQYRTPDPQAVRTFIQVLTLGQDNEIRNSGTRIGNSFVYEVTPGTYEIVRWDFQLRQDMSEKPVPPLTFTAKAGETVYIGHLNGNVQSLCLSNRDEYATDVKSLRKYHPVLGERVIKNAAKSVGFSAWPLGAKGGREKGSCQLK